MTECMLKSPYQQRPFIIRVPIYLFFRFVAVIKTGWELLVWILKGAKTADDEFHTTRWKVIVHIWVCNRSLSDYAMGATTSLEDIIKHLSSNGNTPSGY